MVRPSVATHELRIDSEIGLERKLGLVYGPRVASFAGTRNGSIDDLDVSAIDEINKFPTAT